MNNQTQDLQDELNANDTLFSDLQNALAALCEERGLNPDDFFVYVAVTTAADE